MVSVRWNMFYSDTFPLTAGVRQCGVLSLVLFCIYIDGVIQRLEGSKLGCCVGGSYVGCILYADNLVLMSPCVCNLQRMIDLCADELYKIVMLPNAGKCAVLRFGSRFCKSCVQLCVQSSPIKYCNKVKYLGVMLRSSVMFSVE